MKNYDRINTRKPEGIENRRAFIVGAGNALDGYISRGERELELYMECLWYLFSMVPSLEDEWRTVLDETRECNKTLLIDAKKRLFEKQFKARDISSLELTKADIDNMVRMLTTPEKELENVTIKEWFTNDYFKSNLWYYWSSMLAFQPYHSLIEMKRYTVRFMQHLDGIENLKGILRTKYDQYNSMILPLQKWLEDKGVSFVTGTTVEEIHVKIEGQKKTVTHLEISSNGKSGQIAVVADDLVYFTNGSMTQNSSHGDMKTPPTMNKDAVHRGCFSTWEKLATISRVLVILINLFPPPISPSSSVIL